VSGKKFLAARQPDAKAAQTSPIARTPLAQAKWKKAQNSQDCVDGNFP
jgi:hypothetical protein